MAFTEVTNAYGLSSPTNNTLASNMQSDDRNKE